MTNAAHSDNLSQPASEESYAKGKASIGIPENNFSGKRDNPDVYPAEDSHEAPSADSRSKLDNTSGNTSAVRIPAGILTSPDLESQGDSGQLVDVLSDEDGKELL